MPDILFRTVHGSRLYGLATPDSDMDVFEVTTSDRVRARHNYDPELKLDTTRMGLTAFRTRFTEGSHQSVEALFSPYKIWYDEDHEEQWGPYLMAQRIQGQHAFAKYERTIKSFCFGDFKRRRHAVRLAQNLEKLRADGRFNPVMTETEIHTATAWAERYKEEELWQILTN